MNNNFDNESLFNSLYHVVMDANEQGIIPSETAKSIKEFCESANYNNPQDIEIVKNIIDTTIQNIEESVKDDLATSRKLKLCIYESASRGDINEEERDYLLSRLQ